MLGAEYVEFIHDELVSKLWPGSDPLANIEYTCFWQMPVFLFTPENADWFLDFMLSQQFLQ